VRRLWSTFSLVLLAWSSFADQRAATAALERATNAFNQGRYEEAEKQADAATRAEPKRPEISNLRGAIFTKEKRYDEAAQEFDRALALDPNFFPAKLNRAELKLLQGKYAEATQEYEALKVLDPASELVEFKLVLCALLSGEQNKASGLADMMTFPGKTPAYYYARAAIALKRGEKWAAQKYFENVKKYYSDEQCAYFVQSLSEIDLNSVTTSQPEKPAEQNSEKPASVTNP
jgi:tetratricopeptide (TPR) repeat protein